MKKLLILIPILFLSQLIMGQNTIPQTIAAPNTGSDIFQKLNIRQDPRLVELVKLHIQRNQQGGVIKGFRVEIFFSSELNARQKAQNIKNDFLNAFPDYNVYISYVSPDFIVRVGDFRTKNEALRFMKEIQGQFPKSFVVPDMIELPKLF